jgi:hypothetical protein
MGQNVEWKKRRLQKMLTGKNAKWKNVDGGKKLGKR